MAIPQCVDISVYQRSDPAYFQMLKRLGCKGTFIQTNYGTGYPNPKAAAQIRNSSKYLDFTGCYEFFLGNPVAEAKAFLAYLHYYGMDSTTPVMIDVEPNTNYNGPMTHLINQFTDIVYKDGYHNIFIYSMASWLRDGYHIKPELLKHGRIWAAAYGTSEPGVVNASIWQFTDRWHGLSLDGDYIFIPLSILTGKGSKPQKSKHEVKAKAPKKPVDTYIKHGHKFKAITDVNGYQDINFKARKGTLLKKGSVVNGRIMNCGKTVTRIYTDSGYFSGNTKLMKAIG